MATWCATRLVPRSPWPGFVGPHIGLKETPQIPRSMTLARVASQMTVQKQEDRSDARKENAPER